MIGYVAEGTRQKLATLHQKSILARYSSRYYEEMIRPLPLKGVDELKTYDAISLEEQSFYHGLWNLGERERSGLMVDLKKIPVKQETIEIANLVDCNPYELQSKNAALLTAVNGLEIVEELRKKGFEAFLIGKTTKEKAKLVINGEEKRFLTPPERTGEEGEES